MYIILLKGMSSTNWAFEAFPALHTHMTSEDMFALLWFKLVTQSTKEERSELLYVCGHCSFPNQISP